MFRQFRRHGARPTFAAPRSPSRSLGDDIRRSSKRRRFNPRTGMRMTARWTSKPRPASHGISVRLLCSRVIAKHRHSRRRCRALPGPSCRSATPTAPASAKNPPVAAPLTTGTIARRYAGIIAEAFRQAAAANGLQGAVAAAETRTKASTGLPDLDGLTAQLAATLQKLFDALDAQLAQIAAFKQQPGLPQSPKQLGLREQVDEMQRTEPPLRLPP